MKTISTIALSLALAFAASPARADAKEVDAASVKKFLAFFDKLVDTIVADKDSCPKMAKDINALVDGNQDLLAAAAQAEKDGKKMPDDAQKHMKDSVSKMLPAMMKCKDDKDVTAALTRLDMKHPAPPAAK